jgi:hypothetical protein
LQIFNFFLVTIKNKEWKVVDELPISDYARTMLDLTGEVKHFENLLTHCKVFLKTISLKLLQRIAVIWLVRKIKYKACVEIVFFLFVLGACLRKDRGHGDPGLKPRDHN